MLLVLFLVLGAVLIAGAFRQGWKEAGPPLSSIEPVDIWHSYSQIDGDGNGVLIVERRISSKYAVQFGCDAAGQLGFQFLVTDRAPENPAFADATIKIGIGAQVYGSLSRLERVGDDYLALSFADRDGLDRAVAELSRTELSSFDVIAACALWDGELPVAIGAIGLPKLAAELVENAHSKRAAIEMIRTGGADGSLIH